MFPSSDVRDTLPIPVTRPFRSVIDSLPSMGRPDATPGAGPAPACGHDPALTSAAHAFSMNIPRAALLTLGLIITTPEPTMADERLLDDFRSADGRSTLGTAWQGFTDRVMGGRSDLEAGYVDTDRGPAVRMQGTVRLDNNGGFVQLRLPLVVDGRPMDASAMTGFRVEARGEPGAYYLHLRTTETRRPWAYYRAPLSVTTEWQTLDVPMDAFEAVSTRRPLDASRLVSVGLVAYGEAFEADLQVRRLSLTGPADIPGSDRDADR